MIVKKVKYLFEGYNLKIPKELDDLMLSEIQKHKGKWSKDDIKEYRAGVLAAYWANPQMPGEVKTIQGSGNALQELQPILKQSIIADGELWDKNNFLKILANITGSPDNLGDMSNKLNYVYQISKKNDYNLDNSWYTNRSLYDRDFNKFKYTLNALELLNDRVRVRSYFNPDVIDMKKLYYKDGQTIKTATDIYNQIEEWEKVGNKNKTKGDYSFNDFLRNNNVKIKDKKDTRDLRRMVDDEEKINTINDFIHDYATKEYTKNEKKIRNNIVKYVKNEVYLENTLSSKLSSLESVAKSVIEDIVTLG